MTTAVVTIIAAGLAVVGWLAGRWCATELMLRHAAGQTLLALMAAQYLEAGQTRQALEIFHGPLTDDEVEQQFPAHYLTDEFPRAVQCLIEHRPGGIRRRHHHRTAEKIRSGTPPYQLWRRLNTHHHDRKIRMSCRLLPADCRARYLREWTAEVDGLPPRRRARFAVHLPLALPRILIALRRPTFRRAGS